MSRLLHALIVMAWMSNGSAVGQKIHLPTGAALPNSVGPIRILSGHTRWITALAFSPDDKTLASAGDKTIRIWDVATGGSKHTLNGHSSWTQSIAFSPGGDRLASSGEDNALIIWSTKAWEQLNRQQAGKDYALHNLTFTEQGDRLAGTRFGTVTSIFDPSTGLEIGPMLTHPVCIAASISWSPNGKYLAVGSFDYGPRATVWEISPSNDAGKWLLHGSSKLAKNYLARASTYGSLMWVRFSRDPNLLVCAYGDEIVFRQMSSGKEVRRITIASEFPGALHPDIAGLELSPDGKQVAVIKSGIVQLWDLETNKQRGNSFMHEDKITCMAFSHDGKTLATGGRDNNIKLWDISQSGK